MLPQTLVVERLALHHVEGGVGDVTGIERVAQGRRIDARAARRVDDVGAGGQASQRRGVEQMMRLARQRTVQAQKLVRGSKSSRR